MDGRSGSAGSSVNTNIVQFVLSKMDGFMNIETNPIVRILGQESDIQYMDRTIQFFFALACVRHVTGSNYVSTFMRAAIRMSAALAFVIPLMLGGLPSADMKGMDEMATMVIAAMVFNDLPFNRVFGDKVNEIIAGMCSISYAIMKANACAAGYVLFSSAFSGSILAPFLGAFIATNGHRLVESGVKAFDVRVKGSNDDKVAVLGGLVLYCCGHYLAMSAMVARATLAGMNVIQTFQPHAFDELIDMGSEIIGGVHGAVGMSKGASKRGRSRTPSRR